MVVINEVLCKIGFTIFIIVVAEMFFESQMEGAASLSDIFLITVLTDQLVYAALLEFVLGVAVVFLGELTFQCFVCLVSNF